MALLQRRASRVDRGLGSSCTLPVVNDPYKEIKPLKTSLLNQSLKLCWPIVCRAAMAYQIFAKRLQKFQIFSMNLFHYLLKRKKLYVIDQPLSAAKTNDTSD